MTNPKKLKMICTNCSFTDSSLGSYAVQRIRKIPVGYTRALLNVSKYICLTVFFLYKKEKERRKKNKERERKTIPLID